jgi:response regulator NasT
MMIKSVERKKRILLVDDDRLVLATLRQGLADRGYEVDGFDNGPEALESYRKTPPDLVVLDVRMPGKGGPETARAMLQCAHRPILMLSAYDDRAAVKEAVALGAAGYLVKPIEVNQLIPSIEATLARFAETNALLQNSANLREGMEQNRAISTAVGIVMERAGLSQDQAFERLRQLARKQQRALRDVARDLVEAVSSINAIANGPDAELTRASS